MGTPTLMDLLEQYCFARRQAALARACAGVLLSSPQRREGRDETRGREGNPTGQIGIQTTSGIDLDQGGGNVSGIGCGSEKHPRAPKAGLRKTREAHERNPDLVSGKASNEQAGLRELVRIRRQRHVRQEGLGRSDERSHAVTDSNDGVGSDQTQ
jgi:hypothetical protein